MATYTIGSDPGDDYASYAAFRAAHATDTAGDTISFRRGDTFREQITVPSSGNSGARITYTAHGTGDLPKIYGSTQVSTWAEEGEGSHIWYATCAADPVSVWFVNTDESIIWGTEQASKVACTAEYSWWWDDPNNRLYIYAASDPDSRYTSVEKPTRAFGVYGNAKDYITVSYLETAFCYSGANNDRGVFFYKSASPIIEYCVSHHNGDLGDGSNPQGNGIWVQECDGSIIRYNTLYENARRGSVVFNSDNVTVEHNESYNNYHANFDFFLGSIYTMDALTIRYNHSYTNSAYGAHGKGTAWKVMGYWFRAIRQGFILPIR